MEVYHDFCCYDIVCRVIMTAMTLTGTAYRHSEKNFLRRIDSKIFNYRRNGNVLETKILLEFFTYMFFF